MNRGLVCQTSIVETALMAILVMGTDGVRPGLRT